MGIASVTFDTCTWNNFQNIFPFGPGRSTHPDCHRTFKCGH
jgi:hypothetical protein